MSSLFAPYRSVGVVCNEVPPVVRFHPGHREFYVSTVAERRLLTYKVSNAGLKTVSDPFPEEVACLAQHKGHVIAGGAQGGVFVVRNSREVNPLGDARLPLAGGDAGLRLLESFGNLLVGLDTGNRLHTWRLEPGIVLGCLLSTVELDGRAFPVSAMCHPYLYENKIVLGSGGGSGGPGLGQLQLWNVAKARMVHAFQPLEAGVTCLAQAPAEDLLAVGLASGLIQLLHLKRDAVLMRLRQDFGPVAGLAFRTDGHPVMLSGSRQGQITVWHLEDKRVCGLLTDAHPNAAIAGLHCLHSQPLAVTTGGDNCLRVWIFDRPDGLPRLLHQRAGHSRPPSDARFYTGSCGLSGAFGADLVSAGLDSGVRVFSLEQEALSRCLGKARPSASRRGGSGGVGAAAAAAAEVMPPIREFACEPARHGDWCTMVACHAGTRLATTWDLRKACQGPLRLEPRHMSANEAAYKSATAECVDLSNCGNFVLIGYSSGHVIRFNAQSGREAKRPYEPQLPAPAIRVRADAHNRMALAVSSDGHVIVYAFKKGHCLTRLTASAGGAATAAAAELHRPSGLVAVASATASASAEAGEAAIGEIRLYQLGPSMAQPVRVFPTGGGGEPLPSTLRFSPDGAWLMAAGGRVLRTYSILQGCPVDRLECDSPIACFDMSPSGDLLLTGHRDRLGLQVWVNSTLFKPLISSLSAATAGQPLSSESAAANGDGDADGLVTLTGLPPGRWQCLVDLDAIRARNAVRQPLVAPKSAPFFLSSTAATASATEETGDSKPPPDVAENRGVEQFLLSDLSRRLLRSAADDDPDALIDCLASLEALNPTSIDSEIRDLSEDAFPAFLAAAAACLTRGTHFDTSQAYLAVFLRHHGVAMATSATVSSPACREALDSLRKVQRRVWSRLSAAFQETDCLLAYTRDGVIGHAM